MSTLFLADRSGHHVPQGHGWIGVRKTRSSMSKPHIQSWLHGRSGWLHEPKVLTFVSLEKINVCEVRIPDMLCLLRTILGKWNTDTTHLYGCLQSADTVGGVR
jgi:hypothetical protein